MPNLYFTIGLPRSGKSTYCEQWCNQSKRVIVSSDDIRMSMTNQRYNPYTETLVFATKHIMVRALLRRGFDVIVDGTHSTEISIMRLLEIDINAQHVIIDTPLEECVRRAKLTNQEDLIPTIQRIDKNMKAMGHIASFISNIKEKVKERNLYGQGPSY